MAIMSNNIQNNGGGNSGLSTTATRRTVRTGNTTLSFRDGDTLRGVVSDVHGNEITITMDDGSSFTGKLGDASRYSIGQKAAFIITGSDAGTIYMKSMSDAYLLGMDDTIEQALEEAGLPKTVRNFDVVKSLLNNQQSISRENIMNSLQLCARYPDADVNSVITANRLGFPMDKASVTQFDQYANQTHQLVNRMDTLADSVNSMISDLASSDPDMARRALTDTIDIALDSLPSLEEFNLATSKVSDSMALTETQTLISDENVLSATNPDEAEALEQALLDSEEPLMGSEDEVALSNKEAGNSPFNRVKQLFTDITDRAMSSLRGDEQQTTSFIREQAGFILSETERADLADTLESQGLSQEITKGLRDGSMTAREVLTNIRGLIDASSNEQLKAIIDSPALKKILKGQFLTDWTLSPAGLKEEGSIEQLYTRINAQLDSLGNLGKLFAAQGSGDKVVLNTSDMQSNIQFMQQLNEQFAYLQLPLKLSENNAHGDLYVMTKKNSIKQSPDNLKVLLHLEMDSLGQLDIHITKEHTNIATKFYVDNNSAKALLERNIEMLKDAINNQGYAFTSEFLDKEKQIDIVKDFIEKDAPVGNISRYNFDLRA